MIGMGMAESTTNTSLPLLLACVVLLVIEGRRLARAREAELRNTFLHELAHLVAFARAGRRRIAPHGPEWREACHDLGIPDEDRCHALDFQPRRLERKYLYTCPHCGTVIRRVRRLRRRVAGFPCCRAHAGGRFNARFQLVESRIG